MKYTAETTPILSNKERGEQSSGGKSEVETMEQPLSNNSDQGKFGRSLRRICTVLFQFSTDPNSLVFYHNSTGTIGLKVQH